MVKLSLDSFIRLSETISDLKFRYWYITAKQQQLLDQNKYVVRLLNIETQNAPIWQHGDLTNNHDVKGIQEAWDNHQRIPMLAGWFVSDDFTMPPSDTLEYLQGCIDNVTDSPTNHFHIADGQHRWIAWKTYSNRHTTIIPVLVGLKKEIETEVYTKGPGIEGKVDL